jgi:tRNA threonylcarbamoyl adenosine modification protein (Sua5/YciO/YrdC/YwlC family)
VAELFGEESPEAIEAAAAALAAGRLIVMPTETVFGLAADPTEEGATGRVFAAKRRSRELTLPVLVADLQQARGVAALDPRAEALAAVHWPGPLTIVARRRGATASWDLGDERGSVGVRVPDHPLALSLLRRTGPLAVTSANVSGESSASDCDGVLRDIGDHVAVALCWGPAPRGRSSTVADVTGPEVRVLREGDISSAAIRAVTEGAPEGLG